MPPAKTVIGCLHSRHSVSDLGGVVAPSLPHHLHVPQRRAVMAHQPCQRQCNDMGSGNLLRLKRRSRGRCRQSSLCLPRWRRWSVSPVGCIDNLNPALIRAVSRHALLRQPAAYVIMTIGMPLSW